MGAIELFCFERQKRKERGFRCAIFLLFFSNSLPQRHSFDPAQDGQDTKGFDTDLHPRNIFRKTENTARGLRFASRFSQPGCILAAVISPPKGCECPLLVCWRLRRQYLMYCRLTKYTDLSRAKDTDLTRKRRPPHGWRVIRLRRIGTK